MRAGTVEAPSRRHLAGALVLHGLTLRVTALAETVEAKRPVSILFEDAQHHERQTTRRCPVRRPQPGAAGPRRRASGWLGSQSIFDRTRRAQARARVRRVAHLHARIIGWSPARCHPDVAPGRSSTADDADELQRRLPAGARARRRRRRQSRAGAARSRWRFRSTRRRKSCRSPVPDRPWNRRRPRR